MNHEQGKAPIDISLLTKEQFDNEIQKGYNTCSSTALNSVLSL